MTTPPRRKSTREAIRVEIPGDSDSAAEEPLPSAVEERRRAETQVLCDDAEGEPSEELEFEVFEAPAKYRLERPLGRGGFGVVWLATDTELERPVALKFLTEAGPADVARFRREARFAACLDHPAVVEVYELTEHAGRWLIAMEFLEGGNLEEADLAPRELALALREVAVAMGIAHQHGIVHRDIKPENILLDAAGRAHLTDFGIAADVRRDAFEEEGTVVGTPDLMAPEQARGETANVDARTDVYALGATLYSLLTKHRPFARASMLLTLTAVLRDEPIPPRAIDPTIPPALAAISLRCLEKSPSARYPSMSAVVKALDAYLEGGQVSGEEALVEIDPVGLALEASHVLSDWDRVLGRRSRPLDPRPLQGLQASLTSTLRARPDLAWVRFLRGRCALRLGRYLPALDDLERSIDRLANQAWAQREVGELYLQLALLEQEQPARGLSFVSRADHLDVTRGYLAQAVLAFEQALGLSPDSIDWQLPFSFALDAYASGRPALAQRRLEELLADDPDLPWAWRLLGRAASAQGQDPRASYRAALEVRRGDVTTLLALGEEEALWGELTAAEVALDRALRAAPTNPGVLLARAQLHLRRELELDSEGPGADALVSARDCLEHAWSADPLPVERRLEFLGGGHEVPRATIEAGWVTLTLEALEGLGPRPEESQLSPARAHLLQAHHLLRHGGDPRPDLDVLLRACQSGLNSNPGGASWLALLGEAWGSRGA
ncbi:MAG: protein kinase [Planctomycetes bacterium]|nr:protein kinase [Planctomycetota bacterium]